MNKIPKHAQLYLSYVAVEENMSVSLNDKLQCNVPYEKKNTCKKPNGDKYALIIESPSLNTLFFETFLHPKSQARGKYFSSTTDMSQVNNCFKLLNFFHRSFFQLSEKFSFSCIYKSTDNEITALHSI